MRFIKLGLISAVVFFLLLTIISLLFPSRIRISRATNLPNQRSRVFDLLRDEKRWHPAADSSAGNGLAALQTTVLQKTDSTLVYALQQPGRKPVTSGFQLYGPPSADSLTLQWYMDFRLSWYPWEKFSSLFYEKTYGTMMEQGLNKLKTQW